MDIHENHELPSLERAQYIVSQLSLDEKISQLQSNAPEIPELGISSYNWMNEGLHGIRGDNGEITTVFPQAIGLAATWRPEIAWKQGNAISDEARALANQRGNDRYLDFWNPVINIGRDPRWGRTQEGYGEDPHLVSKISNSLIKGLQGNHPKYFKVLSAPKHFIANNEEYRRHSGSSEVPIKVLRDYYLPAFYNSIVNAGAQGIMTAYNALNGIPCTLNEFLLKDILRGEWNFPGWVVTDCGAIYDVHINHEYETNPLKAVALSLKACIEDPAGHNGQIGVLFSQLFQFFAHFLLKPDIVSWIPKPGNTRKILSFGSILTVVTFINKGLESLPELMLGKALGTSASALFSRGLGAVKFSNETVLGFVSPIVTPYLSEAKRNGEYASQAFEKATSHVTVLIIPILFSLAVVPDIAISLLFGDQWIAATKLVTVLSIVFAIKAPIEFFKNSLKAILDLIYNISSIVF